MPEQAQAYIFYGFPLEWDLEEQGEVEEKLIFPANHLLGFAHVGRYSSTKMIWVAINTTIQASYGTINALRSEVISDYGLIELWNETLAEFCEINNLTTILKDTFRWYLAASLS